MHIRKTLIALAAALTTSALHASPESDAVTAFERLVSKATATTEFREYKFSEKQGGWLRVETKIGRPTYDIQRTTSLLNPVTADLKFEHETQISEPRESEEAAGDAPMRQATKQRYENRFQYSYHKGAWALTSAKQCWHVDRRCMTVDIPLDKIAQSKILSTWLP